MADYEKYLGKKSQADPDFEDDVTGTLVKILSPREQNRKDTFELKLEDGTVEIPTAWKALIVDDDGVVHAWRWPAYIDDETGENSLGLNCIRPAETEFDEVFKGTWHFYRDNSRRARIEKV